MQITNYCIIYINSRSIITHFKAIFDKEFTRTYFLVLILHFVSDSKFPLSCFNCKCVSEILWLSHFALYSDCDCDLFFLLIMG